jgi:hypothetical protein
MFDKGFETAELNELSEILQDAHTQHAAGDMGGCYQTLGGYWPRFLARHVPALEARQITVKPPAPSIKPVTKKPTLADRFRRLVPRGWF